MKILVVEDEPTSLKLAQAVLSAEGRQVLDAEAVKQAFETVLREKPGDPVRPAPAGCRRAYVCSTVEERRGNEEHSNYRGNRLSRSIHQAAGAGRRLRRLLHKTA